MKSIFLHFLTLYAAIVVGASPLSSTEQQPLSDLRLSNMAEQERVPGHNNATYGPVARADQVFNVEFLEIAPTPIIADRIFFVYLRGYLPESWNAKLRVREDNLTKAVIHVTRSVVLPDGRREEPKTVAIPFKTAAPNAFTHLAIRDSQGTHVDYLPGTGTADILLDFQIPTMFIRSGTWTFGIDARLGDDNNTCLFAMSLTQWLDGALKL